MLRRTTFVGLLFAFFINTQLIAENGQVRELFSAAKIVATDLSIDQSWVVEELEKEGAVLSVRLVDVNANAFEAKFVVVPLSSALGKDDVTLKLESKRFAEQEGPKFRWEGLLDGQDVAFQVDGDRVSGSLFVNGYEFSLLPLGKRLHAFVQRDVGKPLFKFLEQKTLSEKQQSLVSNWSKERTTSDLLVIDVDQDAFQEDKLSVQIPRARSSTSGPMITIEAKSREGSPSEALAWRGSLDGHPVRFKTRKQNVYGSFTYGDFTYDIRPLGGSIHALIQRDRSRIKEHPEDAPEGDKPET